MIEMNLMIALALGYLLGGFVVYTNMKRKERTNG